MNTLHKEARPLLLNIVTEIDKYMGKGKAQAKARHGGRSISKNFIAKGNILKRRGRTVLLSIVTEIHKRTGKGKAQVKARQGGRSISKKFHSQKEHITK